MSTKFIVILSALALIAGFSFGRWSAPEKVKEIIKVVEVEKKTSDKQTDTDRDTHKKTTVIEVTDPDGTTKKTTEIIEDSNTNRKTTSTETDQSSKTTDTTTETTRSSAKTSILGLAGISFTGGAPSYGVSVSRPLLGPIETGLWYLTPGVAGVSLGLQF